MEKKIEDWFKQHFSHFTHGTPEWHIHNNALVHLKTILLGDQPKNDQPQPIKEE